MLRRRDQADGASYAARAAGSDAMTVAAWAGASFMNRAKAVETLMGGSLPVSPRIVAARLSGADAGARLMQRRRRRRRALPRLQEQLRAHAAQPAVSRIL